MVHEAHGHSCYSHPAAGHIVAVVAVVAADGVGKAGDMIVVVADSDRSVPGLESARRPDSVASSAQWVPALAPWKSH